MPEITKRIWRFGRGRPWLLWGLGLFIAYLLVGFFVVPVLVKWQLLKQLPPATHRLAAVRQVKFNPLALSLTVRGLALTETNGQSFASFDEFYANFQSSSLFRWAWTFDQIRLSEPRLEVRIDRQKRLNLANLFEASSNRPPTQPSTNKSGPRLLVFDLSVTNGHLGFADSSLKTPFQTDYEPINFQVTRFTTRPGPESPYAFEAASDSGRSLAWGGTVAVEPIGSHGRVRITGIQLPRHAPYLEDLTRVQVADGTLDVEANYWFAVATNGVDLVASNLVAAVRQLVLKDPDTKETVASMPSIDLRGGELNFRGKEIRASSIMVTNPVLLVRRLPDGSINIPSLILRQTVSSAAQSFTNQAAAPAPAQAPWTVALDEYRLSGGTVKFEDASFPERFQSLLAPIDIHVQHFSTRTNAETAVEADFKTEAAEQVNLAATYAVNPAHSTTHVQVKGIDLKKYQPYLNQAFRGQVTSGQADVLLELAHTGSGEELQAVLTNSDLHVSNLQIALPSGGAPVITLPQVDIEHISARYPDRISHVSGVKLSGAEIFLRRETNGLLNLLSLAVAGTNAPAVVDQPSTNASKPWSFGLDELALRDWALHLLDAQTAETAKLDADQLNLTLQNFQSSKDAPVTAELSVRVNGAGHVGLRGTVSPLSRAADAEIKIEDLDLRGFQPWLGRYVRVRLDSGSVSTAGRGETISSPNGSATVQFKGDVGIHNFSAADGLLFKPLVRFDDLALAGVDLNLQTNAVAINAITLSGLRAVLTLDAEKQLNLLSVLPAPSTNGPAPSPGPPASETASATETAKPFQFRLGELELTNMAVAFTDQSIQPPCALEVQKLDGTIKGLSSDPSTKAAIDLAGRLDETAPFALRGQVNPLSKELALALVFTNHNLQLTAFTPYAEKYVGHALNKGRLSLDLTYDVNGKGLKAQNKVHIDQLLLGPRNNSPEATKLPVKLAVALLKDNSGRIDLDLPVEGRLDDPQFSVGGIILKILGNLITKAAASPFKLIGALVGGGEELSFVEFQPGTARMQEGETNKLTKLVQALNKRPALSLEIEGSADPGADRDALAMAQVKDQIRVQRLQELSAIGQEPPSSQFQVAPVDYDRLLRSSVFKTCGTNLSEAIREIAERAAAATNKASAARAGAQGPGFGARLGSLFKPSKERAATRQAHASAKADALLLEQNPELGRLTADQMELLVAGKTDVPPDKLQRLVQDRTKAVQGYLVEAGIPGDRLFLVTPKANTVTTNGEARVRLALQ